MTAILSWPQCVNVTVPLFQSYSPELMWLHFCGFWSPNMLCPLSTGDDCFCAWWYHNMGILSSLLAVCKGNPSIMTWKSFTFYWPFVKGKPRGTSGFALVTSDMWDINRAYVTVSVWNKNKVGSQNFGHQNWCLICNTCNVFKIMFDMGLIMW